MPFNVSDDNELGIYLPWSVGSALGKVQGISTINKFGHNLGIDTNTVPEDVWDGGGTYNFIADDSPVTLYASSTDAGDNQIINGQGLDAGFNLQSGNVTLNGQSQVEIGSGLTWTRFFRGYNTNGTAFSGTVYIAESDTLSGGVPQTSSKIKAIINPTYQQTEMAIYTVPAGYTAAIEAWWVSILRGATTKAADVLLYRRDYGGVFRDLMHVGISTTGTGYYRHPFTPAIKLLEKTDIKITVDNVTSNNTIITGGFDITLNANT